MSNKFAYITALSTIDYLPGLIVLEKSLRKNGNKYPLVVMTEQGNEKIINAVENLNLKVREVNEIDIPELPNNINHYWNSTFIKLSALSLTEYEKIVFIDCDIFVNGYTDELFNKPNMSAAISGKARNTEYWQLNSGVFVLEPDIEEFEAAKKLIPELAKSLNKPISDQDIYSKIFIKHGWKNNSCQLLNEKYNEYLFACKHLSKRDSINLNDIACIHFVGKNKPWKFWWRIVLYGRALIKWDYASYYFTRKYLKFLRS